MAVLVWDQIGERVYETGVSRGVLYTESVGVAWNGLTAVEEQSETAVEPVYFDGVKINDVVTVGDFKGTLKALTYPDEFLFYEGAVEDTQGFFAFNQPPSRFGLSWRTNVGDDSDPDAGYKIHLLYNVTAVPSSKSFETLNDDSSPTEFEWSLTAIPEDVEGFRPTPHVVIDSKRVDPALLTALEHILYGNVATAPYLPTMRGLVQMIRGF